MKTYPSICTPTYDAGERNFAAFVSDSARNSLRRVMSPRVWFMAGNWDELDAHLHVARVRLALVEPAADGKIDLTALSGLMRRHSKVPIVAYVALSAENLMAIVHLSRYGLSDVLVAGLGDEYHQLAEMVERVCANRLSDDFLSSVEGELGKLGPRLMRTVEAMFAQPQRFRRVSDIARQSGISTKHVHRAFRLAHLGTPKKLLIAAKLVHAYSLLRNCMEPVREISARVGYADARTLSRHCAEVFGCHTSQLRFEPRTSEMLLRVLGWLCEPATKCGASLSNPVTGRRRGLGPWPSKPSMLDC